MYVMRDGLWTPNEALFHQNPKFFCLWQTNWAKNFGGILCIFGRTISPHFGTVSPLSMFSINYFYKELSLYIRITLGFELGPQRIRNLVIVCP